MDDNGKKFADEMAARAKQLAEIGRAAKEAEAADRPFRRAEERRQRWRQFGERAGSVFAMGIGACALLFVCVVVFGIGSCIYQNGVKPKLDAARQEQEQMKQRTAEEFANRNLRGMVVREGTVKVGGNTMVILSRCERDSAAFKSDLFAYWTHAQQRGGMGERTDVVISKVGSARISSIQDLRNAMDAALGDSVNVQITVYWWGEPRFTRQCVVR